MNSPTIAVVLAQFLAEQDQRLAPKTVTQYRDVVELLQHYLNDYAYRWSGMWTDSASRRDQPPMPGWLDRLRRDRPGRQALAVP